MSLPKADSEHFDAMDDHDEAFESVSQVSTSSTSHRETVLMGPKAFQGRLDGASSEVGSSVSSHADLSPTAQAKVNRRLLEAEMTQMQEMDNLDQMAFELEQQQWKLARQRRRAELQFKLSQAEIMEDTLMEENTPPAVGAPVHSTPQQVAAAHPPPKPQAAQSPNPVSGPMTGNSFPDSNRRSLGLSPICSQNDDANHTNNTMQQYLEYSRLQYQSCMDTMRLPTTKIPTYDGDPLRYYQFVRLFQSMVDKETVSANEKLTRLHQYTSGKAREVIEYCLYMPDEAQAYTEAWKRLKSRFGNDHTIAQAWIDKVTIRKDCGSTSDLQDLADDLRCCRETLVSMGCAAELDNRRCLLEIIKKLPSDLQKRWLGVNQKITDTGRLPALSDVLQYIENMANQRSDSVFGFLVDSPQTSKQTTRPSSQKHNKKPGQRANFSAQNTDLVQKQTRNTSGGKGTSQTSQKCPKCSETHYLNQCPAFRAMAVSDRSSFVKSKDLCMNCFQPGHFSRDCPRSWTCNVEGCGAKHNRWLHPTKPVHINVESPNHTAQAHAINQQRHSDHSGNQFNDQATHTHSKCLSTGSSVGKVALPIVPVKVRDSTQSNKWLSTYALLDTGSNQSFCSEELAQQLGAVGHKETTRLTTLDKKESFIKTVAVDLMVSDLDGQQEYEMKHVLTRPMLNIGLGSLVSRAELAEWPHLTDIEIPDICVDDVHLLIGQDVPDVLIPNEVRVGKPGDPYATKTALGWTLNGPIENQGKSRTCSHFIKSDTDLHRQVERFWRLDEVPDDDHPMMSVSDKKVLSVWENSIIKVGLNYQMDIPFKHRPPNLPNNRHMAAKRLQSLQRKLSRDETLRDKYIDGIKDLIEKGYAEQVPPEELNRSNGYAWYLPHHPVINPHKPDKIRIVFDCSATYLGTSLNSVIHQGPDFINQLIGVLLRFRQEHVAMVADIESMFQRVKVTPGDRDALQFLWCLHEHLEPTVFRMTTHLFGGVWSPSCANFALKRTAEDHKDQFDTDTIQTVDRDFYMDDCLRSVPDEGTAVRLAGQLRELLALGGFRLTKWLSNSREVLRSVPEAERSKAAMSLDLDRDDLPCERTLGVLWQVETDEFSFNTNVSQKPFTKRGLLSVTSSIFDPLGFVCPFVLKAKLLFQQACRLKLGWDDHLPTDMAEQWKCWLDDLSKISLVKVQRCFRPSPQAQPVTAQLHHFSDASEQGYGSVSYVRFVDGNQDVHCSMVMAKAKLAPLKTTTIPRLELAAATVSAKLDQTIRRQLNIPLLESVFWTDSTIVLHYLRNEEKRYQTFVANRVALLRDHSSPSQWRFVDTSQNPADDCSRGLAVEQLASSERWLTGPGFLWEAEEKWPTQPDLARLPIHPLEIKQDRRVYHTQTKKIQIIEDLLSRFSSWLKLRRAVAWVLRLKSYVRHKFSPTHPMPDTGEFLTVSELQDAEKAVLLYVQQTSFGDLELKDGSFRKLCPVKSSEGLWCVGGRLNNAAISNEAKHPILLPCVHEVTDLILSYHHARHGHVGVERTLGEVRQKFWIVGGRVAVRRVLGRCMTCRKLKAPLLSQRMADLPKDRITPGEPPFTRVGVDYFGPILVKRARSDIKRWGCVFTCLVTRAVHLEVAHSLDTDGFLNALQRFIARRGQPKEIRSDNGSNFVGGQRELKCALQEWNQSKINKYLQQQEIQWIYNPPAASHMGGVWERIIRSVRSILLSLSGQQRMDDERLSTLMCLAEGIINGRPITKLSDDPTDPLPLTPNHIILLRSGAALPPGLFVEKDIYRRRWRQVQYLADVFWTRWLKDYLPTLQLRHKWLKPERNLVPGDLVLVRHENTPRGQWPLGLILQVHPGKDNLVRSVQVKTQTGVYERPIDKLCLLEAKE